MLEIIKRKYKVFTRPYLDKWILDHLDRNCVSKRQGWKGLIKSGINRDWDPAKFRKEVGDSLMVKGFKYHISVIDGKTKSRIIITKNNCKVKELHFFNNDGEVVIRRLNGFIGMDCNILITLLDRMLLPSQRIKKEKELSNEPPKDYSIERQRIP